MSWYWWKRWRFAWAVGTGKALRHKVKDGHGTWTCVVGKLFFLTHRR